MDCHDSTNAESRNDEVADALVFRHCERSEAIHNFAYIKDFIAESRIDKIMDCYDSTSGISQWQNGEP